MPDIHIDQNVISCSHGDNLRKVLMKADPKALYNHAARWIHCRGLGTCGTCAVSIEGEVSPMTKIERARLKVPPLNKTSGLRLACQVSVLGDLNIKKGAGLWGQHPA